MHRSRSSSKLETHGQLTDEQLFRLILKAYEESTDMERLQMTMKDIMTDDPERIRVAYKKVVEMKARTRSTSEVKSRSEIRPPITLALKDNTGRASSRRRSRAAAAAAARRNLTALMDASELPEPQLEELKADVAALRRIRHQNLLNLVASTVSKGNRFTLDFDLIGTSHVTLLDMFQEEIEDRSLNGCEIACILAQACLGLLFLLDLAMPALEPIEICPAACLCTENIILTDRGMIKLSGHHSALRLPTRTPRQSAVSPVDDSASPADDSCEQTRSERLSTSSSSSSSLFFYQRPGFLAHRVALLLYELDHQRHQSLRSLRLCSPAERAQLDQRYAQLFSLCSDWPPDKPVDLRCVLYSTFICEQTSSIPSYQSPLEIVFASRFTEFGSQQLHGANL